MVRLKRPNPRKKRARDWFFCRFVGLKRNAVRVGLMRIGYNMKRGLNLLRKCVEL